MQCPIHASPTIQRVKIMPFLSFLDQKEHWKWWPMHWVLCILLLLPRVDLLISQFIAPTLRIPIHTKLTTGQTVSNRQKLRNQKSAFPKSLHLRYLKLKPLRNKRFALREPVKRKIRDYLQKFHFLSVFWLITFWNRGLPPPLKEIMAYFFWEAP